jgi:short-subunit dehydrogenase
MEHRTAFVTGASSGIGFELSKRLAKEGIEVGVAARREDELRKLEREILELGGRVRVYPLDVTDVDATTRALERADEEMGGIDLVVANAGVGHHRWSGKLTYRDCAPVIAVNIQGAVATLTALLPKMVARKRGHLVGVSSLAQYRGMPNGATYAASKAFLSHFLEGLRIDLRGTGVAVTDLRPGFVRTPMTAPSPYPMPFMMDLGDAVEAIVRGIRASAPIVAFPWQLATLMRAGTLMPTAIYDKFAGGYRKRPNGHTPKSAKES